MPSTPQSRLLLILLFAFTCASFSTWYALQTPTLEISLTPQTQLTSPTQTIIIEELDLTPEPGEITDNDRLERFYSRQQSLSEMAQQGSITYFFGDESKEVIARPRTLSELSHLFWIQLAVGLGALIISGWVWALRSRDLASTLFALSGLSTLMFTFSAAIYTTRDFALNAASFKLLTMLNSIGAAAFGIFMLALFLVYPLRVKHFKLWIALESIFFSLWTLLAVTRALPAALNVNFITLIEMLGICTALGVQYFVTRGQPQARASLTWLGLAVLLGAGSFIALNATPIVLGLDVSIAQGYAFLFFLVIYLGLAAGLIRYRLFEVGRWAFSLLFYALGAVVLVALDAGLIFLIGMDRLPALGMTLLLMGLLYLPLRDLLWRKWSKSEAMKPHELLAETLHVAFAPTSEERSARWETLIKRFFNPLEIVRQEVNPERVQIEADGLTLLLPAVASTEALRISYPWRGKSLFTAESKALAHQLVTLIEQAESNREAYDRGVSQERRRMAQDLHDDIGARLLTGLHLANEEMKPTMQAALADIRAIVSEMTEEKLELSRLLADARFETSRRLELLQIELDWPLGPHNQGEGILLDYRYQKAIRSALREIVSNVIRHAEAKRLSVKVEVAAKKLHLSISDDGRGFAAGQQGPERQGYGLVSLKRRLIDLGGTIHFESSSAGTQIKIEVPFESELV